MTKISGNYREGLISSGEGVKDPNLKNRKSCRHAGTILQAAVFFLSKIRAQNVVDKFVASIRYKYTQRRAALNHPLRRCLPAAEGKVC